MQPVETPNDGGSSKISTPRRPDSNDYIDIDLTDEIDDTRMPAYIDGDLTPPRNGHQPREITLRAAPHAQPSNQQKIVVLKPVAEQTDEVNPRYSGYIENWTTKHEYFILEADPRNKKERGVMFLTDKEGRDLPPDGQQSDVKGTTTKEHERSSPVTKGGALGHRSDESADGTFQESNPYYSEIRDIDYSLTCTKGKVPDHSGISRSRFSDKRFTGRVPGGEYEEIGVGAGKDTAVTPQPATVLSPGQPLSRGMLETPNPTLPSLSHTPLWTEEEEEMIMIDNVAYESADNIHSDVTQKNGRIQDDGDELVMIDNVAYESADSMQEAAVRQRSDEECEMIDNVLYESSSAISEDVNRLKKDDNPQLDDEQTEVNGAATYNGNNGEECVMIEGAMDVSTSAFGHDARSAVGVGKDRHLIAKHGGHGDDRSDETDQSDDEIYVSSSADCFAAYAKDLGGGTA